VQTCIWPSWCHCHSLSLAPVKSRLVLPFWYRLTRVVPDKGSLNGCVVFTMECPVFGGGGCSSQTIHPPSKLRYNRHILVVSTISRNDSCHPKLCRLRCTLVTRTPPKIPGSFLGLAKPYTEIQKFLTGVRSETPIRVCCFKHGLNRCRKSVEKAALYWSQKKTKQVLVAFGRTPGAISPNFLCKCALWFHTYIPGFIQIRSGLGSYIWKPFSDPQSDFNRGSSNL